MLTWFQNPICVIDSKFHKIPSCNVTFDFWSCFFLNLWPFEKVNKIKWKKFDYWTECHSFHLWPGRDHSYLHSFSALISRINVGGRALNYIIIVTTDSTFSQLFSVKNEVQTSRCTGCSVLQGNQQLYMYIAGSLVPPLLSFLSQGYSAVHTIHNYVVYII